MITIILILTFVSFVIWLKYGRDEKTIPVVSFEAPAGLNPAEVELVYNGKITIKGLIALLFYLANKGYLKAVQENLHGICGFEKIKDYDGSNFMEKDFLEALFVANRIDFYSSDYFMKYYPEYLKRYNEKKKILFEKTSLNTILKKIMLFCFAGVLLLTILCLFTNSKDIFSFLLGLVCVLICGICTYHLPKRNLLGLNILGKIEGLKKFLEITEKHKLKSLIEQNPKQFYEILPYLIVLGVFGHVADLIGNVMLNPPNWYEGEKFDIKAIKTVTLFLKVVV